MDLFSKISKKCTSSPIDDIDDDLDDSSYNTKINIRGMGEIVNGPHSHKPQRLAIMKAQASSELNRASDSENSYHEPRPRSYSRSRSAFDGKYHAHPKEPTYSSKGATKDRRMSCSESQELFDDLHAKENYNEHQQNSRSKGSNRILLDRTNSKENINVEKDRFGAKRHDMRDDEINKLLSFPTLNSGDIEQLIEILPHHKVPLKQKLQILFRIDEECNSNKEISNVIFNRTMMYFLEGLLDKYCSTIAVFGHNNFKLEEKLPPPKELCLLSPLIRLFVSVFCTAYSTPPHLLRSDAISHLANAVTFISCNMDNIQRKIIEATRGKTLYCKAFKMTPQDTNSLVENLMGFSLHDPILVYGAFQVTLFETSDKETTRNINEEIVKIQPPMNCTKAPFAREKEHELEPTDKKYITVIRTIVPKYVLMYMEKDWRNHLNELSNEIRILMKQHIQDYKLQRGDIVGFSHDAAEFENKYLAPVTYLRGQIISQLRGHVLVWALDLGTWAFVRRTYLHGLRETKLETLKPLVSVGCLQGPVCELDEEFLQQALLILITAARKNIEIGKTMLLSNTGENLLIFAEYPNPFVRLRILDFILSVVKSKEICKFLHKQGFHIFLAGKLDCCAHVYKSYILHNQQRIKAEIIIMTKILLAILDATEDGKWVGQNQALRAFNTLLIGEEKWHELFDCVIQKISRYSRTNSDPYMQKKIASAIHYPSMKPNHYIPKDKSWKMLEYLNEGYNGKKQPEEHSSSPPARIQPKEEKIFILGNKEDIVSDQTTHIMTEKSLRDVLEMTEVICGLLNNNIDGSLYFGLSDDSVVVGITMKEEDKNSFVKDVNIIMQKFIRPSLPTTSYMIQFAQVVENKDGRLQAKHNTYIIQVFTHPQKRLVYALHDGNRYYTRKGSMTLEHYTAKKPQSKEKEEKIYEKSSKPERPSLPVDDVIKNDITEAVREVTRRLQEDTYTPNDKAVNAAATHNFNVDRSFIDTSDSFLENTPPNYLSPLVRFLKKFIPNTTNE